jgi:hypothetical protein
VILTKFWLVRNPGPHSELNDILMEFGSFQELTNYIIGGTSDGRRHSFDNEYHQIHTDKASAERDAEGRFKIYSDLKRLLAEHAAKLGPT